MTDLNIPSDFTALSNDEREELIGKIDEKIASLRETGVLADKLEAKRFVDVKKNVAAVQAASVLADEVLASEDKVEETSEETAEEAEVEDEEIEVTVEIDVENNTAQIVDETEAETVVEDAVETIDTPIEASESKQEAVANVASISDLQNMRESFDGRGVQSTTKSFIVPDVATLGGDAEANTRKIASLPTPNIEGVTSLQKAFGVKTAASCQPAEVLRQAYSCGRYNPVLSGLFRTVATSSMQVKTHGLFDSSDSSLVGQVDLNADPIVKDCYEPACAAEKSWDLEEAKACFTINEQIKFSSDLALQTLIDEGDSYLAAEIDTMILQDVDAYSHPYSFAGTGRGFGDVSTAVAAALGQVEKASPLTNSADSIVLVPKSMLGFLAADNYSRNHSWTNAEYVSELFGGRRVVAIDDYIDAQNTPAPVALPAPGGAAEALTVTSDWFIRIINPDDAFQIIRSENQYGLQAVDPSIEELKANKSSYFARAYTKLGLLQDCGWVTIDMSGICVGNRAAADAACV